MRYPNTECGHCHNPIYKRPTTINKNNGNVFCGQRCYGLWQRKEVKCLMCPTMIMASKHAKTCSRECEHKRRAEVKSHGGIGRKPRGSVTTSKLLKKRLIALRGPKCEQCPYANISVLQPHHIIKRSKGGSDELSNLKLLCPNCHCTIHYGDSRISKGSVSELGLSELGLSELGLS